MDLFCNSSLPSVVSVSCSFVVTCCESALLYAMFSCAFVAFSIWCPCLGVVLFLYRLL